MSILPDQRYLNIGGVQTPVTDLGQFGGMFGQQMNQGGILGAGPVQPDAGLGLGLNMSTAKLGLGGIATLGNLWGAFQANKLAKKQFNASRDFANTNLENSIKSYNTALDDKARSRAAMEGQTDEQRQAYIDKNRLSR